MRTNSIEFFIMLAEKNKQSLNFQVREQLNKSSRFLKQFLRKSFRAVVLFHSLFFVSCLFVCFVVFVLFCFILFCCCFLLFFVFKGQLHTKFLKMIDAAQGVGFSSMVRAGEKLVHAISAN